MFAMYNPAAVTISYNDCYFCTKDGAIGNPAYGTLGRFRPTVPDRVVTDEVVSNEAAVYETMPDNGDDVVQSVRDHNETDYDVIL